MTAAKVPIVVEYRVHALPYDTTTISLSMCHRVTTVCPAQTKNVKIVAQLQHQFVIRALGRIVYLEHVRVPQLATTTLSLLEIAQLLAV